MLLTACGSGTTKNEAAVSDRSSYDTNYEYAEDMPSEEIDPENINSPADSEKEVNTSDEIIRKEMLVYSPAACSIPISKSERGLLSGLFPSPRNWIITASAIVSM